MIGKVFNIGKYQAVSLPKECRINSREVYVGKVGSTIMLFPIENKWSGFEYALNMFSDDFFSEGREDQRPQEREPIV